jgi:hypothetical protein
VAFQGEQALQRTPAPIPTPPAPGTACTPETSYP